MALEPVPMPARSLPADTGSRVGPSPRTTVFGDGPVVIGHRGLGCGVVSGHRENTLDSFTTAVALGMRWVEADVRLTGDGTLVVAHDAARADGTSLVALSGEDVDRCGVLRLRTLFDTLPPDVGVNVDLKSSIDDSLRPPERTTAGRLAPVVAEEARRRPLMVSSFDPAALCLLRSEAPEVPLAWLTWYRFPVETAVAGCAHMDVDVLALHVGSFRRDPRSGTVDRAHVADVVALVHGCGRQLLVWCPQAGQARMLAEAGADALVVDEGPHALGVLGGGG
jgi:glycerophosphoryl diester phosphodiesterase